jgi:Xaa-Pro aminopeptidase
LLPNCVPAEAANVRRVGDGEVARGGPVDVPRLSLAERDRRWARVRELMDRDGIDVIFGAPNTHMFDQFQSSVRYLTGLGGNCASVEVVFPRYGEVTAIVSPDQSPDYLRALQDWVFDIRPISPAWAYAPPLLERLAELGAEEARIGVIGLQGNTRFLEGNVAHGLVVALHQALPRAEIKNATPLMDEARFVKSDEEIACLERATLLAEGALDVLQREAAPGVPERRVYARMLEYLVEQGGDLPTMILWSAGWPQPSSNHYQPTGRPLQRGDVIHTELEARWAGYVGQRTQVAFIGPAPEEYRTMFRIQQEALARCYDLLRPGATVGDLVKASAAVAQATPYTCRILMHGRGLGDDSPIAIYGARDERMSNWVIQANSTFMIKPMVVYGQRERYVYWGDTVVATESGARRLGRQPPRIMELGAANP